MQRKLALSRCLRQRQESQAEVWTVEALGVSRGYASNPDAKHNLAGPV
jgi:hypothetical protein